MSIQDLELTAAHGTRYPTRVPANRMRHSAPAEGEYKFRHARWPDDKKPAQPWPSPQQKPSILSMLPTQPAPTPVQPGSTRLVTEPHTPASAALTRVPLAKPAAPIRDEHRPQHRDEYLNITNWTVPLDTPRATPITLPSHNHSIQEQFPAQPLPVFDNSISSIWRDIRQYMPILGGLSYVPVIGLVFAIIAVFIGTRPHRQPLPKRAKKGFTAASIALALHALWTAGSLAFFLFHWVMGDIHLLWDLFM